MKNRGGVLFTVKLKPGGGEAVQWFVGCFNISGPFLDDLNSSGIVAVWGELSGR